MIKSLKYFLMSGVIFLFLGNDCNAMQDLQANLVNLKLSLTELKVKLDTLQGKLGNLGSTLEEQVAFEKIVGWANAGKILSSTNPTDKQYNFLIHGKSYNAKFVFFEVVSHQSTAIDIVKYLLKRWPDLRTETKVVAGSPKTAQDIAAFNKFVELETVLKSWMQPQPKPGPQTVPLAQHLLPITDSTPAWVQINNVLKDTKNRNLWNPATPAIRFYFPENPNIKYPQSADYYGNYFGNYSNHPVNIDGETFATTEHYFQAQKVVCVEESKTPRYYQILNSKDPDEAKDFVNYWKGANKDPRYLADPKKPNPYNGLKNPSSQMQAWFNQSANVMRKAIHAKVDQNADVKQVLLSTGDAPLLEHSVKYNDKIWGIGTNGDGKNLLGIILMEERAKLQP